MVGVGRRRAGLEAQSRGSHKCSGSLSPVRVSSLLTGKDDTKGWGRQEVEEGSPRAESGCRWRYCPALGWHSWGQATCRGQGVGQLAGQGAWVGGVVEGSAPPRPAPPPAPLQQPRAPAFAFSPWRSSAAEPRGEARGRDRQGRRTPPARGRALPHGARRPLGSAGRGAVHRARPGG